MIETLVTEDGKQVSDQNEILKMMGKYYQKLYKSKSVRQTDIDSYLQKVQSENKLSEAQKEKLENMPTEKEFFSAINGLKENKSPGIDGIPIEFYKTFWTQLKTHYMEMIFEAKQNGQLPYSSTTSILSLIHKGENTQHLDNYRPLSLSNYDYKILACVFSKRMKSVLPFIINSDQTANIANRYIGCSIRNIVDIYDYTGTTGEPGAFTCADFEKAFDTIEIPFILSVLEKFNFGKSFITWIKLMYTNSAFRIKNNGWISTNYDMERGLRQGCPCSALLFVLAVEVLATLIRNDTNIRGIEIGGKEHRIVQYADDTTLCVRDIKSVEHSIELIQNFSDVAGPKLDLRKTKGIWLGDLKDLGIRKCKELTFTGNPVKCLGIYIGHKVDKCRKLNWDDKLEKIKKAIVQYRQRQLTLFERAKVIKTFLISKIIFPASILHVPEEVIKDFKDILFTYLWNGKRDRVNRSSVCNKVGDGGLNMLNIDAFLASLKAVWVTRLCNKEGKWADVFRYYLNQISIPFQYVFKLNINSIESFPIFKKIPIFYQEVLINCYRSTSKKSFKNLSDVELLSQPLWGNENFKVNSTCLYLKN